MKIIGEYLIPSMFYKIPAMDLSTSVEKVTGSSSMNPKQNNDE